MHVIAFAPLAAALAPAMAGCAAVERPDDWHSRLPPPPGAWAAPGPFDAMEASAIWGTGDSVTYAIDIDDAGTHRGFTFTLTTTRLPPAQPDASEFVHPVHGRVLTTSAWETWQMGPFVVLWGYGPARFRAELRGDDGSSCSGEFEHEAIAHLWVDDLEIGIGIGVRELFRSLLGLDCMHAALLRVIRPPSLLSILGSLGSIQVALEWPEVPELSVVEQDTPLGRLPTVWVPITIVANGQPALDGRIQFTWKRSPLLVSAGVLQIESWHPDDPARRVTVRLASARRGTPPDAPDPLDLQQGLRVGMTTAEVCAAVRGKVEKVHQRGRLADGRRVELVKFDAPGFGFFGVVHDDRLLYVGLGSTFHRIFLRVRGFVPDGGL